MPKLSIIVPIYKVEKYLDECIQSILRQTFTDYEVLLIDDGSPDACPQMCDAVAEQDGRVRVIHQKNGGVSAARNAGLDAACGEWIGFVDPDDVVAPDFYEKLMYSAHQEEAECAICSAQGMREDGICVDRDDLKIDKREVITGKQILEKIGTDRIMVYLVLWNKIFRRECWNNIRFPVGEVNEDDYVFAELFAPIQKVACLTEQLYFYRTRSESIMTTRKTLACLAEPRAFQHCFEYFQNAGMLELLPATEKRIFGKLTGVYYLLEPKDRRAPETKAARKMQLEAVKTLYRYHLLSGRTLFRTILFQVVPGIYGLRRRPVRFERKV